MNDDGSTVVLMECVRCGARQRDGRVGSGCPACAEAGIPANVTPLYDMERARAAFVGDLAGRPWSSARYAELMPIAPEQAVSLGEGGTPLIEVRRLADRVGVRRLWVKDESANPTWSFKDRAAAIAAAHARLLGCPGLVVASTGNAAAATAAYARRAGLKAVVLFARGVDRVMAAYVTAYGAHVLATPTKADRWRMMRHCVEELGWYPNSNFADPPLGNTPWPLEGYKGIGFEVWEQLGRRAPGWIFLPAGYGDGLYGVSKSFRELEALGLVTAMPRCCGGEIYGSLARALASGGDRLERVEIDHDTAAFSIATTQSTFQALTAVRSSGGWVEQVREDELLAAQQLLIETEGIFVETASAAGLASLIRQRESSRVPADAEVVLINTSAGLKGIGARLATPAEGIPLVTTTDELDDAINRREGAP